MKNDIPLTCLLICALIVLLQFALLAGAFYGERSGTGQRIEEVSEKEVRILWR